MSSKTYVISCGGTGGHLAPGIALAEALTNQGHKCHLLISKKKVDARLVEKYTNLDFTPMPGAPFSLKPHKLIRFVVQQLMGMFFAFWFLNRTKPDMIIGFGGFSSSGMILVGFFTGRPIVLHEANRPPGKTIRLLSGFAQRVYLPEGVALKGIPPQTIRHCGFPLRSEMQRTAREKARQELGLDIEGKLLLLIGGSQGALSFNHWVNEHFDQLCKEHINVYCITGMMKNQASLLEKTSPSGRKIKAYFVPFSDQMPLVFSAADLAISRAGAGTIAELTRFRLPSILVPYPHSSDNHQQGNARFLERQGGAVVLDQQHIDRLYQEVMDMIFNDWFLEQLRSNLARLDEQDSLSLILKDMQTIRLVPEYAD
tara:strand:+ start:58333 stop:59442 length:1110 start_codon:yes stop_codon:yes gene_type:complete